MHWRWLIGDYADPGYRLTREQRRKISDLAQSRYTAQRAFLHRTLFIALPPIILALWALKWAVSSLFPAPRSDIMLIGLTLIVFLVWPWSAWAYGAVYARPFRRAMYDLGLRPCLACGYRLDGLPLDTPRCPECGKPNEVSHAAHEHPNPKNETRPIEAGELVEP
jgi:hypothetical protein